MSTVTNINRYQRRRGQTKREILVAAQKVLAAKGYHDMKIVDIADAADVGVGTFYVHFATKDAVFQELVEQTVRTVKTVIDQAWEQDYDVIDKVRTTNRCLFAFAQDHRELFKIVFGHGNAFHEMLRRFYTIFTHDVAERVGEGMTQKVYRPVNPDIAANALVGMFGQLVSWWVERETPSAEEMAVEMTALMLHGLARSPSQSTS